MKQWFSRSVVLWVLCAVPLCGVAAPSTVHGKSGLEQILKQTVHMQGQFTQLILSEGGKQTQTSTGRFWLAKPGRFRWDYEKPYVQNIVSDGQTVWFYDPDLEQVTIKPAQTGEMVSPLSIIGGDTPLDQAYMVKEKGQIDAIEWLELFPILQDSSYESIHIGIADGQVVRMILNDQFGQSTRLLFSAVDTTSPIDPERFQFTPPPGVDVFEDR